MPRTLFGRKPVPSVIPPALVQVPANAALALVVRLDPHWPDYESYIALKSLDRHAADRAFDQTVRALPPIEPARRSELLCAIAESGILTRTVDFPLTADAMIVVRLRHVLELITSMLERQDCPHIELEMTPRVFSAVCRLLGDTEIWVRPARVSYYPGNLWQARLAGMVDAGHLATPEDIAFLKRYRAILVDRDRQRDGLRENTRGIEALVKWLDKVCGTTPDTAERLRRLATPTVPPSRFPADPPNLRFWTDFLIRAAAQTRALVTELERTPDPAWLDDAQAYAARFPHADGISRPFGWWNDDTCMIGGPGVRLRGLAWARHCKSRPAEPGVFEAALTARAELASLHLVWSGEDVPELARLADIADADQAGLLLHLADAKSGPKPPTAWLATARRLAAKIGSDAVRNRLADWLEQFARVAPTPENHARLHNYQTVAGMAARLEQLRPDLPLSGDTTAIDRAAAALAINAGGRYTDEGIVFASENGWLGSSPQRAQDYDRGHLPIGMHDRWRPSIGNEALLRGVLWLFADLAGAAATDLLEHTALSAMAYSDSYSGARTRATANAAIAALARIGSPGALEALGRLRRTIKDKAIAGTIAKGIAVVAGKTGVAPADVEEMSVPDYGFA